MNLALHSMSHIIIYLCFLHGLFDVINFLRYMVLMSLSAALRDSCNTLMRFV